MRIIVFATQKGGCGKSTLAACLAVAAQEAGERVLLLDMDPKKSLSRWGSKRNDRNLLVRAVSPTQLPATLRGLTAHHVSLVLIDTPFLESPAALAAIKAADLVVVPARPATFDIWASEVTGRRLKLMGRDFVFLLNQCPPSGTSSPMQEATEALEAVGSLLRPRIRSRVAFLHAARRGKGVTEVNPKGEAAREIRELWLALRRRLPAG